MTQDKTQEALGALTDIEKIISEIIALAYKNGVTELARFKFKEQTQTIRQALQSQPHTCTASGYECKSKDDKVDIEIELTDEAIISLALYAHRHDITINDAFTQLVRLGVDTDELPPVNEATGHDTE